MMMCAAGFRCAVGGPEHGTPPACRAVPPLHAGLCPSCMQGLSQRYPNSIPGGVGKDCGSDGQNSDHGRAQAKGERHARTQRTHHRLSLNILLPLHRDPIHSIPIHNTPRPRHSPGYSWVLWCTVHGARGMVHCAWGMGHGPGYSWVLWCTVHGAWGMVQATAGCGVQTYACSMQVKRITVRRV